MDERVHASEAQAFLAGHPETEVIDAFLSDLSGVLRGKRLRRDDLDKFYGKGLQLPGTTCLRDVTGISVDPGGRGYSDGDLDMCIDDPDLDVDLYITTDPRMLTKVSMGDIPARDAARAGAVELHGAREPALDFMPRISSGRRSCAAS